MNETKILKWLAIAILIIGIGVSVDAGNNGNNIVNTFSIYLTISIFFYIIHVLFKKLDTLIDYLKKLINNSAIIAEIMQEEDDE